MNIEAISKLIMNIYIYTIKYIKVIHSYTSKIMKLSVIRFIYCFNEHTQGGSKNESFLKKRE
jgi:hypothetical protein